MHFSSFLFKRPFPQLQRSLAPPGAGGALWLHPRPHHQLCPPAFPHGPTLTANAPLLPQVLVARFGCIPVPLTHHQIRLSAFPNSLALTANPPLLPQVLVARFGCIPVPITDFVLQPFEPELNWTAFSVPVAEADIPRMHEILDQISGDRLAQMQVRERQQSLGRRRLSGGALGEDSKSGVPVG